MAEIPPRLQDPSFRFVLLGSSGEKLKKPYEKDWPNTANYPYTDTRLSSHRGNIGVCGGFGDLLILDSDDLPRWEELGVLALIPKTLTIESRPGHRQFYLKCAKLTQSASLYDPEQTDAAGDYIHIGDVKGTGGQAVAPGSRHPSGSTYQIVVDAPIAEVNPEHLQSIIQKFRQHKKPNRTEQNVEKLESMAKEAGQKKAETDEAKNRRYALAALRDEVSAIEHTPEGDRNSQLNRSAYSMGQLLAIKALDEGEVILALSEAASRAGLDSDEIRATIRSGLNDGRQQPRKIPEKKAVGKDNGVADGCDSGPKESMATRLAALARKNCLELWHTPNETCYITLQIDGHREYKKINSKSIKSWLSKLGSELLQSTPSGQAINAVVALLEGIALYDGQEYDLFVRKAEHDGKIYVDIGDETWRVIEISKDGWQIIEDSPVRFYRPMSLLSLPIPEAGGDIGDFRQIVNIAEEDEDSWILYTAWLSQAFWCRGPYTHLHVRGPQGSAKSGLAENTKAIIDPSRAPKRHLPRSARELMMGCQNEAVPSFDNVSTISEEIADTLCIISTGGSSAARALYTDDVESIIYAKCPVIMNGIADPSQRGDLLDRLIVLDLNQILESDRISEKVMRERMAEYGPKLLGVLLDATVTGLLNIDGVTITNSPRMADFAQWAVACSPSLGWEPETFLTIYNESRQEIQQEMAETNRLMRAIARLAGAVDVWDGTATQLLDVLNCQEFIRPGTEPDDWPRSAKTVGTDIRRLVQPALSQGIAIRFHKSHGKLKIEVRKIPENTQEEGVSGVGEQNAPTPHKPLSRASGVRGVCSFLKVLEYRKERGIIERTGEIEKKERNRESPTPPTPGQQVAISQNAHLPPPTPDHIEILVLGEIKQFVGTDMLNYGPYHPEDVASIPVKNAQNLAAKNLVRITAEA